MSEWLPARRASWPTAQGRLECRVGSQCRSPRSRGLPLGQARPRRRDRQAHQPGARHGLRSLHIWLVAPSAVVEAGSSESGRRSTRESASESNPCRPAAHRPSRANCVFELSPPSPGLRLMRGVWPRPPRARARRRFRCRLLDTQWNRIVPDPAMVALRQPSPQRLDQRVVVDPSAFAGIAPETRSPAPDHRFDSIPEPASPRSHAPC